MFTSLLFENLFSNSKQSHVLQNVYKLYSYLAKKKTFLEIVMFHLFYEFKINLLQYFDKLHKK